MTRTSPAQPDPDPSLGRRARKALASRRAMFAAGLEAFDRQPIGLVSVLDITEAADVAKGVFYLHFRSKDEFLIALWEDVQQQFLDSLGVQIDGCRSLKARRAAIIDAYHRFAIRRAPAVRFWLRLGGYFMDEIGEPGRLASVRRSYFDALGSQLFGVEPAELTDQGRTAAMALDGCCLALTSRAWQLGEDLPDPEAFRRIVDSAVRAAL